MRIFIILLLISAGLVYSQETEKEQDVRLVLKKEISAAQRNMENFRKEREKAFPVVRDYYEANPTGEGNGLPITKMVFILTVSITSLSYVYYRRQQKEIKKQKKRLLKSKVLMLREEKLATETGKSYITDSRRKYSTAVRKKSRGRMSDVARELNVSKGELLFAARLRAHIKNNNEKTRGDFSEKVTLSWKS